jgi:Fe-S cluster biosynthesis and repair protein YggX
VTQIVCTRCGNKAAPPSEIPYTGELREEIGSKVCASCWDEWLEQEVKVINELRLNFMDPESQEVLTRHLREFLALDAASGG